MRCSEPLTTGRLRVRAIPIQCGSKELKTKLYLRDSLDARDSLTRLLGATAPAEERAGRGLSGIEIQLSLALATCVKTA